MLVVPFTIESEFRYWISSHTYLDVLDDPRCTLVIRAPRRRSFIIPTYSASQEQPKKISMELEDLTAINDS